MFASEESSERGEAKNDRFPKLCGQSTKDTFLALPAEAQQREPVRIIVFDRVDQEERGRDGDDAVGVPPMGGKLDSLRRVPVVIVLHPTVALEDHLS
ncbi:MAG: hypothetical protein ACFBWO_18945 [Paracoccaceae bacterium]